MKRRKTISFLIVWCFILSIAPISIAKTIKLNLAVLNSESSWGSISALKPWVRQIEKATGGNIAIETYYSQTLARGSQSWDAVVTGEADMAWCDHGYWPERSPFTDVINLPGLPFHTSQKGSEILWKVFSRFQALQDEFRDVKVLILYTGNPRILITRKDRINAPDDLTGLRIRVVGKSLTAQLRNLGGIPVNVPLPDNYIALKKGLIDGMVASWETIYKFRLYEVVHHFTEAPLPPGYYSLIMNKKVWGGLSRSSKDAIMSVSGLKGSRFWGANYFDSLKMEVMDRVRSNGRRTGIDRLKKEERKKWIDISCKPIWREWLKRFEKEDVIEARKILNAILEME